MRERAAYQEHVIDVCRWLDDVVNTPEDGFRSAVSVQQRLTLIRRNRTLSAA